MEEHKIIWNTVDQRTIAQTPELYDIVGTKIEVGQVVTWPVRRSSVLEMHVGTVNRVWEDLSGYKPKVVIQVWLWVVNGKPVGKYVRLTSGSHRLTVSTVSSEELSRRISGGKL